MQDLCARAKAADTVIQYWRNKGFYFQVWSFMLAECIEAEEIFPRSEGHATLVKE